MIFDRLENLVAQLGIGKAKTVSDRFGLRLIDDDELANMYRGDWMSRKIVDLPVTDCMRVWRDWQAEDDQITIVEAAEAKHQVRAKLAQALRWSRLYGGSAILIGDGAAQPNTRFDPERLGKGGLKYLTVLHKREIVAGEPDQDPQSPYFRQPSFYTLATAGKAGVQVHPSRVIRFIGAERPDFEVNSEGWGDSILQVVYDAVHHAGLTTGAIAELIHDAKVDVIKVANLESHLSTREGTEGLTKRFTLANEMKSLNNMLLLGDTETWERKQTSFAGLPDVLKGYLQIVAGAADIPATRLLGQSPGGLNSTGESDLRNYYDSLDSYRDDVIRPALERLDALLWRDAIGSVPKDVYFEFGTLWQMTEKEKAELADKKATTTQKYVNMGIFNDDLWADVIPNQLIEDGTYPGLEAAIESLRSIRPDPDEEIDEEEEARAAAGGRK